MGVDYSGDIGKGNVVFWQVNDNQATAQTDKSIRAAPGAGYSLVITDIMVSAVAAQTITFEQGTTVTLIQFAIGAGAQVTIPLRTPIVLAPNTALTYTTTAATATPINVCGFTAPDRSVA